MVTGSNHAATWIPFLLIFSLCSASLASILWVPSFPLCFLSFSQSLSCVSLNRLLEEMLNYWVFQKDDYLSSWRQIKLNVIRIGLKIVFQHHLRSIIFIQWRWSDIDVCLKNICNILEKLNRLTIITTYPNKKAAIWNKIRLNNLKADHLVLEELLLNPITLYLFKYCLLTQVQQNLL